MARKGDARAIARLEGPNDGPEYPETLHYLARWARDLHRARRYGMGGAEPITYPDIEAWARLKGHEPTPLEVDALLDLTMVMGHPPKETKTGGNGKRPGRGPKGRRNRRRSARGR